MKQAIVVEGPKHAGKALVTYALAKALQTEVLVADSLQVFDKFNVAAGKPTSKMQQHVKYHLLNRYQPKEFPSTKPLTAWRYRSDALNVLNSLWAQGKVPIIDGGTSLYTKCLLYGREGVSFCDIPQQTKSKVRDLIQSTRPNWEKCVEIIQRDIPGVDLSMRKGDFYRLEKAAIAAVSKAPSHQELFAAEPVFDARRFYVDMDDSSLHHTILKTTLKIAETDLITEVLQLLLSTHFNPSEANEKLPEHALGYRETFTYLKSLLSLSPSPSNSELVSLFNTYLSDLLSNSWKNVLDQRKAFRGSRGKMVDLRVSLDSFSQLGMMDLVPKIIDLAKISKEMYDSECGEKARNLTFSGGLLGRHFLGSERLVSIASRHLELVRTHQAQLLAIGL